MYSLNIKYEYRLRMEHSIWKNRVFFFCLTFIRNADKRMEIYGINI